jgi:hypothetical protein
MRALLHRTGRGLIASVSLAATALTLAAASAAPALAAPAAMAPVVTATIPVGDDPVGVAVDLLTSTAYVTNGFDNTVSVISG